MDYYLCRNNLMAISASPVWHVYECLFLIDKDLYDEVNINYFSKYDFQKIGKERGNSYRKMKRSLDERHTRKPN